jgi:hypothetical protein
MRSIPQHRINSRQPSRTKKASHKAKETLTEQPQASAYIPTPIDKASNLQNNEDLKPMAALSLYDPEEPTSSASPQAASPFWELLHSSIATKPSYDPSPLKQTYTPTTITQSKRRRMRKAKARTSELTPSSRHNSPNKLSLEMSSLRDDARNLAKIVETLQKAMAKLNKNNTTAQL